MEKSNRRKFGVHLTSADIFRQYILPEIKEQLYDYTWIDLYAGEGNLILPILDLISSNKRVEFFNNHMCLFDVQPELVQKCIQNAIMYGIPLEIAEKNIKLRNNLESFPQFLKKKIFLCIT